MEVKYAFGIRGEIVDHDWMYFLTRKNLESFEINDLTDGCDVRGLKDLQEQAKTWEINQRSPGYFFPEEGDGPQSYAEYLLEYPMARNQEKR